MLLYDIRIAPCCALPQSCEYAHSELPLFMLIFVHFAVASGCPHAHVHGNPDTSAKLYRIKKGLRFLGDLCACDRRFELPTFWSVAKRSIQLS